MFENESGFVDRDHCPFCGGKGVNDVATTASVRWIRCVVCTDDLFVEATQSKVYEYSKLKDIDKRRLILDELKAKAQTRQPDR